MHAKQLNVLKLKCNCIGMSVESTLDKYNIVIIVRALCSVIYVYLAVNQRAKW